jgi:predicted CoA-binding protein
MEDLIRRFLAQGRFALVGLSRNPDDFSGRLFRELAGRGYDVVPVNPHLDFVDDRRCYARVQEIWPPVRAALLMTPPALTDLVVRDCAEAGVELVWMHRGIGIGAVSPEAAAFCRAHGIQVIAGACPYMYLPHSAAVHRIHGLVRRLFTRPAA